MHLYVEHTWRNRVFFTFLDLIWQRLLVQNTRFIVRLRESDSIATASFTGVDISSARRMWTLNYMGLWTIWEKQTPVYSKFLHIGKFQNFVVTVNWSVAAVVNFRYKYSKYFERTAGNTVKVRKLHTICWEAQWKDVPLNKTGNRTVEKTWQSTVMNIQCTVYDK